MKKKIITKTYLRDVSSYQLRLFYDESKDFVVCSKKIERIKSPFIISNGTVLMDNNYYILEITPLNENYNIRIYFNDKKEVIEYYIDIVKANGIDEDSKTPYYYDLYLDVIIFNDKAYISDENDLERAYQEGKISKEEYDLAYNTANKLLAEIKAKSNKYINLDYSTYLNF